jgi:hypothetical protein
MNAIKAVQVEKERPVTVGPEASSFGPRSIPDTTDICSAPLFHPTNFRSF